MDEDALTELRYLNRRERDLLDKREHWRDDLRRGEVLIEELNKQLDRVQEMILEIKRSGRALAKGAS